MTRSRGGTGCCSYFSPCCLQLRIASLPCTPYVYARPARALLRSDAAPCMEFDTHAQHTAHTHTHRHTHTHTHTHTHLHTHTHTRTHTHTHVRRFKKLISWCQQVSPQHGRLREECDGTARACADCYVCTQMRVFARPPVTHCNRHNLMLLNHIEVCTFIVALDNELQEYVFSIY